MDGVQAQLLPLGSVLFLALKPLPQVLCLLQWGHQPLRQRNVCTGNKHPFSLGLTPKVHGMLALLATLTIIWQCVLPPCLIKHIQEVCVGGEAVMEALRHDVSDGLEGGKLKTLQGLAGQIRLAAAPTRPGMRCSTD